MKLSKLLPIIPSKNNHHSSPSKDDSSSMRLGARNRDEPPPSQLQLAPYSGGNASSELSFDASHEWDGPPDTMPSHPRRQALIPSEDRAQFASYQPSPKLQAHRRKVPSPNKRGATTVLRRPAVVEPKR